MARWLVVVVASMVVGGGGTFLFMRNEDRAKEEQLREIRRMQCAGLGVVTDTAARQVGSRARRGEPVRDYLSGASAIGSLAPQCAPEGQVLIYRAGEAESPEESIRLLRQAERLFWAEIGVERVAGGLP